MVLTKSRWYTLTSKNGGPLLERAGEQRGRPIVSSADYWVWLLSEEKQLAIMGVKFMDSGRFVTDLYCDPSKEGVRGAKYLIKQLKTMVDEKSIKFAFAAVTNPRIGRWIKEVIPESHEVAVYGVDN